MRQVSLRFQHLHGESGGSGAFDDRGRKEASARHATVLFLRGWYGCRGLETLRLMFDCQKCVPLTVDNMVPSKLLLQREHLPSVVYQASNGSDLVSIRSVTAGLASR
jgi:hypothetical protein